MNHKLTMFNLEKLKIEKLYKAKEIQQEISKIETSISEHRKLYILHEEKSTKAREVLAGYGRQNVRDIIKFIVGSLNNSEGYFEFFKDIDFQMLMDNDGFYDFVIVQIGRPTITEIKKKFDCVEMHNGQEMIRTQNQAKTTENTRNRLWKKLTKKSITTEAKRLIKEMKDEVKTTPTSSSR